MFVVGFFVMVVFVYEYKVGDIEVVYLVSCVMVLGVVVGGGFMEIINKGKIDDMLVLVILFVMLNVQLYEMVVIDGVMKMCQLKDGILVFVGKIVELKLGGLYVMFMGVKMFFKEGDKVFVVLYFQKVGDVKVEFQVGFVNGGEMKYDMKDMNGQKLKG